MLCNKKTVSSKFQPSSTSSSSYFLSTTVIHHRRSPSPLFLTNHPRRHLTISHVLLSPPQHSPAISPSTVTTTLARRITVGSNHQYRTVRSHYNFRPRRLILRSYKHHRRPPSHPLISPPPPSSAVSSKAVNTER
ncbi:hypothetical protein MTR_3g061885 [Medicago truncatula]|uniref:Uncharacterized protein n=1 Tax=Medicago truncatula TaxID=3880 RepID=A0A072UYD6_MEDTR|nr:hypothetical protein MTR_3g061885 [Medicago truncatula]